MFRALGVLVIFTFHKSFINCFPDLTPEAITVYRNPEFFKNLYYGNTNRKDETTTETSQGEGIDENYKYPGETTKRNKPGDSSGFEVTYDNSPEFHHDPRDILQSPFRPSRRKGPYSPLQDAENFNEENSTETFAENLQQNTEKNSEEELKENTEDSSENNFKENSEKNLEVDSEENTGISPEDSSEFTSRDSNKKEENSGEFTSRKSNNKEENSGENMEGSSKNSEEEVSTESSSEEEKEEDREESKQEKEDYNSNENSEETQTRSPDEDFEEKKEPTLLAQPLNPDRISDFSKSSYNQPYSFNASSPILYNRWKHYNYPEISSKDFIHSDFAPLYSEEPSSNLFNSNNPSSSIRNDDNDEDSDSFENIDTKDMGADTKNIYNKLLRHRKLKPSALLKYHSKPKLKKLKVKLKKGKHNSGWFDQYPFNF